MTVANDKALTPITQAQRMLAEAKTLDEFKGLRDYATGARTWAKARGMGVEAENEATEVVLRCEFRIGSILIATERQQGQSSQSRGTLSPLQQILVDIGEAHPNKQGSLRATTRADEWMTLAKLPEDKFEELLRAANVEGLRFAQYKFYSLARQALDAIEGRLPVERELITPEDPGFGMFRAGAYNLLGWVVDDDGNGMQTRNGMLTLPDDELRQMAGLIRVLASAYNEAQAARA